MPASYLSSSAGPDKPIDNWLSWSSEEYKKINYDDNFIAALLGINHSRGIRTIFKPVPVDGGDGNIIAIVGNNSQWKSALFSPTLMPAASAQSF
jgi:hypothetical protein